MMLTVTRTFPNGKVITDHPETIRNAGQLCAWFFYDNGLCTKRRATQIAMRTEKTGYAQMDGYTVTIQEDDQL